MAEKEEKDKQDNKQTDRKDAGKDAKQTPAGAGGLFVWVLIGAITVAGAMGGLALSQLMGGTTENQASTDAAGADARKEPGFEQFLAQNKEDGKTWLYDKLEPVVANLDEPGVTRYVRVAVTIEMSPEMDPVKGTEFLEEKKTAMRDWLTTYFAGLSLEDVRGSRNLNRLKNEVLEQFNSLLFGQQRGYVQKVLFKEFAVQ